MTIAAKYEDGGLQATGRSEADGRRQGWSACRRAGAPQAQIRAWVCRFRNVGRREDIPDGVTYVDRLREPGY